MCKVLKISESGYYRWLKNKDKPSKRHLLLVKINEILSEHPDNANYGYDRIHKALEIRGIKVSRNTVYRAMKDGKLYISPIMDCYNGEILTVEMRDNMKKELCMDTVYQLKQICGNLQGVTLLEMSSLKLATLM